MAQSIWDKVDFDRPVPVPATSTSATAGPSSGETAFIQTTFWRRARPCLDALGALLWIYAALKLFFVDIDERLLGSIAQYRFFAFLAGLALLVAIFRKPGRIAGALAYLILFPLIILCWKLPRALYRSKSWVAAFAVMNVISTVISDLRYTVLVSAGALFASLAVFVGGPDWLLGAAATVLVTLLTLNVGRAIRTTIRPQQFLKLQQQLMRASAQSSVPAALNPGEEDWRGGNIDKFTAGQQDAFITALSYRLLLHRALYFWAYQLDQYRRSSASAFFSALSFLSLILQATLALTLYQ